MDEESLKRCVSERSKAVRVLTLTSSLRSPTLPSFAAYWSTRARAIILDQSDITDKTIRRRASFFTATQLSYLYFLKQRGQKDDRKSKFSANLDIIATLGRK